MSAWNHPMDRRRAIQAGLLLLSGGLALADPSSPLTLDGDYHVHDPSTIIYDSGAFRLFTTGGGIGTRFSRDLRHWERGPRVFNQPPAWVLEIVPGFRGYYWAPDVIRLNGLFHLYYTVSTFGSQVSAIGLATSPTLDPAHPGYAWTDHGPVVTSAQGDDFNAIDPAPFLDRDGKLWLAFGSFWSGIQLLELDPATGKRLPSGPPRRAIAHHDSIEAPLLHRRGPWYYLFVNWGLCCRGVHSTYNIRVGRAASIAGPYLDRSGIDLLHDGGDLLLGSQGTRIGPGQAGIFTAFEREWFSYHYYDATQNGRSMLGLLDLTWSHDGWPVLKT